MTFCGNIEWFPQLSYDRAVQGIRALSLQIASDVEFNRRTGFGVIIVTDMGIPACAIAGDHITEVGLVELLQRDKEFISPRLRFDWNIVNMTVDNAFVALSRQQCGYAAGDANTLRTLMLALRRDGQEVRICSYLVFDRCRDRGGDR